MLRAIKKLIFSPIKALLMHAIVWYQKHLSRHTCMYQPTCSEYMLQSINNLGVVCGIVMGTLRLLRCTPHCKGGYDPAPENYFKIRWVL